MGDEVLVDRYRRLALLGGGSMGEVWLADDLWLHRQVAVKMLWVDPAAGDDPAAVDRMLRAARAAAQLHHPHVVEVFDLVVAAGRPCVVMEYVDGESLAARIGRLGPFAPVDAARLIGQVAGALHAAHRAGIVHGDVKPANIMIDAAGNAKLADFGVARGAGGLAPTHFGPLTGTLAYTAPEAARTGEATSAGDVWSLGATLYAALEGRAPYHDDDDDDGQDPASLLARLVTPMPPPTRSAELTPILLQMLSGEPAERPTAKQVMSGLAAFDAPPAVIPAGPRPVPVAEARAAADPQHTVSRPGSRSYAATIVVAPPDVKPTFPISASDNSTAELRDLHSRRTRRGPWLLLGLTIPVIIAIVAAVSLAGAPQRGPGPGAPHPDRVVKTITATFTLGMAVAPDGQHLYLTNIYGGVSVIDTASSVVRTFSLEDYDPAYRSYDIAYRSHLAVAPDGQHLYAAPSSGGVLVIDTESGSVVKTIAEPDDGYYDDVAVAPDGRHLYLIKRLTKSVTTSSSSLSVIDIASGSVLKTIAVGRFVKDLAVAPDGRHLYVANSDGVLRIDATSGSVVKPASRSFVPDSLAVAPDGQHLYVAGSRGVWVIDTTSGSVVNTLVSEYCTHVAVAPDGKHVYATCRGADEKQEVVLVIDTASGSVVKTIDASADWPGLDAVAVAPDGQRVYVSNQKKKSVLVIGP